MSTPPAGEESAQPDWRHDPRETEDSRHRRARGRRRSQVVAVVAAVLLVVGGVVFLGFVTGRVSLPGLGTLTTHPADAATFQVGRTTYLMQFEARRADTVTVFEQTGASSGVQIADLATPSADGISATSNEERSTYFAVLPNGAHDVGEVAHDPRSEISVVTGAIQTPGGSPLVGAVVALNLSQPPGEAAVVPGLSALSWTDADGQRHTTAVNR